jgi:SAM-dependent methyltransferase
VGGSPLNHLPAAVRFGSSSEHVRCALCAADDGSTVARPSGFRFVECRRCGLVYLDPRPSAAALAELYAGYHARDGASEGSWDRLMREVYRETAARLCAEAPSAAPRRLLDVGCGFGSFLAVMHELGWEAEGLDISPPVVAAAARRGRRVRLGTLEELGLPPEGYQAITMFYVLEHLPDPLRTLRQAWDLLAPEGILLVRVPHTTPIVRLLGPLGLGADLYDPPFHLYDFSPAVLQRLLGRAGFTHIRTFPGRPTAPARPPARLAAWLSGIAARALHRATAGRMLLPGVSKTTLARKPPR